MAIVCQCNVFRGEVADSRFELIYCCIVLLYYCIIVNFCLFGHFYANLSHFYSNIRRFGAYFPMVKIALVLICTLFVCEQLQLLEWWVVMELIYYLSSSASR